MREENSITTKEVINHKYNKFSKISHTAYNIKIESIMYECMCVYFYACVCMDACVKSIQPQSLEGIIRCRVLYIPPVMDFR